MVKCVLCGAELPIPEDIWKVVVASQPGEGGKALVLATTREVCGPCANPAERAGLLGLLRRLPAALPEAY